MGLESLLASLRQDVTAVTAVQPPYGMAFGCNASPTPDVTHVTYRRCVTAVTPGDIPSVTAIPLQIEACTPVTSVTAENIQCETGRGDPGDREAWEERAAVAEFDGGLSREDAELLAWQEDGRRATRDADVQKSGAAHE